jgi:hypothetical protein
MSVYVDRIAACVPNKNWRWNHSAHLFADTIPELHQFAARLALKKPWFQDVDFFPHYDLTTNKHGKAVGLGAIPLEREAAMMKWHEIMRNRQRTCDHLTARPVGNAIQCTACGAFL